MKAWLHSSALALAFAAGAGCGGPSPTLDLFYQDELVEAPTRSIDMTAVGGSSCEQILSREHDTLDRGESELARRAARYPLSPELEIFKDFPRTEPIDLDIAAFDGTFLQVARACTRVTLDDVEDIRLELRALPTCEKEPTTIDLVIALDTSRGIDLADPTRAYLAAADEVLVRGLTSTATFGLVTFGHENAALELVPATGDRALLSGVIQSLQRVQSGKTRLFDGVAKGAAILRSRAVCGRRPVLVVVTGLADEGSEKRFEDARIGLFATQGDFDDDIFTVGIALSNEGFIDIEDLIPEDIGLIKGAQTEAQVYQAFEIAKAAIDALLPN